MLNILWTQLKDYKGALPMIGGMTVLAMALIYIFGLGFSGSSMPRVAVADLDGTSTSERFIENFMDFDGFNYELVSERDGLAGVEDGHYIALMVLEKDFGSGLLAGSSEVSLYRIGSSMEHMTIESNIQALARLFVMDEGFIQVAPKVLEQFGIQMTQESLASDLKVQVDNYPVLEVEALSYSGKAAQGYDSLKHSFIGYLLFFSMFTMVFGIGSIVEQKEMRVWQRLTVSPTSSAKVLFANMLAAYIVSMVQLLLMVIISRFVFGIDWGNSFGALFLVLSCYVIAVIALGLFMSGMVSTMQQLGSFSPIIIVSTSMIGGCMWPLEIISSRVLLFMADLTPQRWAYKGLKTVIVGGGGVGDVLTSIMYLLIIAVILFGLAMVPYLRGQRRLT